jgi:hypothetical protein
LPLPERHVRPVDHAVAVHVAQVISVISGPPARIPRSRPLRCRRPRRCLRSCNQ